MKDDIEDRFIGIETKLSFSEDLLETLNLTVFRQQQQIERLQKLVLRLQAQMADMRAAAGPGAPANEVPPHY